MSCTPNSRFRNGRDARAGIRERSRFRYAERGGHSLQDAARVAEEAIQLRPDIILGPGTLEAVAAKTQRLAVYARQKLPEFENDPEKLSAVKNEIRELIHKLELAQHRGATSIEDGKPPQTQH